MEPLNSDIQKVTSALEMLVTTAGVPLSSVFARREGNGDDIQALGVGITNLEKQNPTAQAIARLLSWVTNEKKIEFSRNMRSGESEIYAVITIAELDPQKIALLSQAQSLIESINEQGQILNPTLRANLHVFKGSEAPSLQLVTDTANQHTARRLHAELFQGDYISEEFNFPKGADKLFAKTTRHQSSSSSRNYRFQIPLEKEVLTAVGEGFDSLVISTQRATQDLREAVWDEQARLKEKLCKAIAGLYEVMNIAISPEGVNEYAGDYKAKLRITPDDRHMITTKMQLLEKVLESEHPPRFYFNPEFKSEGEVIGEFTEKLADKGQKTQNFMLSLFPDSAPQQHITSLHDLE